MTRLLPIVLLIIGCEKIASHPTTRSIPPEDIAIRVVAFDLHAAYADNEALAHSQFSNEWLLVGGMPGKIQRINNRFLLTLMAGNETILLCWFDADQQAQLAEVIGPRDPRGRWHSVKVAGHVAEILHGSDYFRGTLVVLEDCRLRLPAP